MKFCNQCSNMLYISIDENDTNKLIYYCRNCGEKDESITDEGVCVLNTQLKKENKNSTILSINIPN